MLGQRVRTLVDAMQPAREQSVIWDGRNEIGEAVSSGVYLARMQVGDAVQSRAMLITK